MCLQCVTKAVLYGEALPGFFLVRATKDDYPSDPIWKANQLALIESNDPAFILTVEPKKDELNVMSDQDIECLKDNDPRFKGNLDVASQYDEDLCGSASSPIAIYRLIIAAKKVGYDEEKHGTNFSSWLSDHLARYIEAHPTPE